MGLKDLVEYIRRVKSDAAGAAQELTDPDDYGSKRFHEGYVLACDGILETIEEWGLEKR